MPSTKIKLTKRSVETYPVPKSSFDTLHDSELRGFQARIYASGKRSYHLHYRLNGKERRPKIGEHGPITAEQARRTALEMLGKIASGIDPSTQKTQPTATPTVSELFTKFQEWAITRHKPRTISQNQYLFEKAIEPAFGSQRIDQIKRLDIERFHAGLLATPTKANQALTLLKTLFNKARQWDLSDQARNPCEGVQKYTEKRHDRFLTHQELQRLHASLDHFEEEVLAPAQAVAAIRLLIFTGCRYSEIINLTWDEVDFARRELMLRDSKTGAKRIFLNDEAILVLRSLYERQRGTFVIHGKGYDKPLQGLKKIWERIRLDAQLSDVRMHDLRHSFASFAINQGISLPEVQVLMGHRSYQTTLRYAHLSEHRIREAAGKIGKSAAKKVDDA